MAHWLSVGIDGGLHGAVVGVNNDLQVVGYFDTPIIDLGKRGKGGKTGVNNAFLEAEMVSKLKTLIEGWWALTNQPHIWLERAQSMTKQGVSSTFKTGEGFGLWKGILAALGIRFSIVSPKTWQTRVLKGVTGLDTKAKSIACCQRLFPSLPLTLPNGKRPSLDGRSDAALIAYYGMLENGCPLPEEARPKRTPFRMK